HSIHQITLKNTGIVPLNFKLLVTTHESYPVRPSSAVLFQAAKLQTEMSLSSLNSKVSSKVMSSTSLKAHSSRISGNLSNVQYSSNISRNLQGKKISSAKFNSNVFGFKNILRNLSTADYLRPTGRKLSGGGRHYKTANKSILQLSDNEQGQ
ncbi:hypothetical protein L9F63_016869, partial [Diploptera punctata]